MRSSAAPDIHRDCLNNDLGQSLCRSLITGYASAPDKSTVPLAQWHNAVPTLRESHRAAIIGTINSLSEIVRRVDQPRRLSLWVIVGS
jgi:hypothetical protein